MRVPTLKNMNIQEFTDYSVMISAHGKGSGGTRGGMVIEDVLNAYIVNKWATSKSIGTLDMAFLTRQPIFPNLKVLNQNSLMKNTMNI